MANSSLRNAKSAKNDEFYTQMTDIEKELLHYKHHFKDKVVYCNCDDPLGSNFYKYFSLNFEHLGLKKLITTCYYDDKKARYFEYTGDKNGNNTPDDDETNIKELECNGDFRSPECIKLLEEADIVVTNPPFSLFREYVAQLIEHDKKFLIIGNNNAITYKDIFTLIKENKMWLGIKNNQTLEFQLSDDYEIWDRIDECGKKYGKVPAISWFTNLDTPKHHEDLILYKKYHPDMYPNYDNYDAINVDRLKDIPEDYDGVMGVPITFMDKYNPEQFEIIGIDRYVEDNPYYGKRFTINGNEIYARILIRNKRIK